MPHRHQSKSEDSSVTLIRTLARASAIVAALGAAGVVATTVQAQAPVIVGGSPMLPTKNIIENAMNSKDHTTLVAAGKAAGLVDTLSGPRPFTVFAPTNAAFAKLAAGTVDNLMKAENKAMLTGVLTYHVVAAKHSAADIIAD